MTDRPTTGVCDTQHRSEDGKSRVQSRKGGADVERPDRDAVEGEPPVDERDRGSEGERGERNDPSSERDVYRSPPTRGLESSASLRHAPPAAMAVDTAPATAAPSAVVMAGAQNRSPRGRAWPRRF